MIIEMEFDDNLLESLKIIQNECKKHEDCDGCPKNLEGRCMYIEQLLQVVGLTLELF